MRSVQVAGWLPRRVLPTSLQPVPGRLRTYDWGSRIPFDELPFEQIPQPEIVELFRIAEPIEIQVSDRRL